MAIALVQAILILGIAFWVLGAWQRDFVVPLDFDNDASYFLAQAKTTVENGWWWISPRQGAPYELDARAFPNAGSIDQVILWLVSRVLSSPTLSLNFSWLTMLALGGLAATYGLRTLGFSRAASFTVGTLYAFAPCAVYRQIDHFMLVAYLVPFSATAALHLASGRVPGDGTWRGSVPLLAGSALTGFNYVYYAFFGCFFVALGMIMGALRRRDPRVLGAGALWLTTIVMCVGLNLAPSAYAWSKGGRSFFVSHKVPAEAEVYGLKIRQLLSPVPGHALPIFRDWTRKEAAAGFPLETENVLARLGLVPSIGFVVLLATLLLRQVPARPDDSPFLPAAALTVSGVLLATVGGFGSLFNLFVASDIRGYNRIAVFLAFFALVAVAVGIDSVRKRGRSVGIALTLAVLGLGLWDQTQALASLNPPRSVFQKEYRSLEHLVARMEQTLPHGSMVLQLPFVTYLQGERRERMQAYDHFKPYVVSSHLRWSYPALSDTQSAWQQAVSRLAPAQLAAFLAARGFTAILVDRFGYADAATGITSTMRALPGVRMLAESDRYVAFDIRNVAGAWTASEVAAFESRAGGPSTTSLTACEGEPRFTVERLGTLGATLSVPVTVTRGEDLAVSGWAILPQYGKTAADVDVAIDATLYRAEYGLDRADVSAYFSTPDYRFSGFQLLIPRDRLEPGIRTLFVRAVSPDGKCYHQSQGIAILVK